jgi:hypothetical protein
MDKNKKRIFKLTYSEAGYIKAPSDKKYYAPQGTGVRCGNCKYFGSKTNTCALVGGFIHGQGCCNLFVRDIEEFDEPDYTYLGGEELKPAVKKLLNKE